MIFGLGLVILILLISRRTRRVLLGLLSLAILLTMASRMGLLHLHLVPPVHQRHTYLQTRFDVFICPDGLTKEHGERDDRVVCSHPNGYVEAYDLRTGERLHNPTSQAVAVN